MLPIGWQIVRQLLVAWLGLFAFVVWLGTEMQVPEWRVATGAVMGPGLVAGYLLLLAWTATRDANGKLR